MNKMIPVQSKDGAHFGFLLVSGNEGSEGECVFMTMAKDASALENPDFIFLRRFSAKESGEHKWRRSGNLVSIDLTTGDKASMDLEARTLVFNQTTQFRIV